MIRGMLLMAVINLIVQWSMPFAISCLNRTPDNIDLLQERIEHNIERLKTAEEELQAISSKLQVDLGNVISPLMEKSPDSIDRESLKRSALSAKTSLREMRDQHLAIDVIKKTLVRDIGELQEGLGLEDTKLPSKEQSQKRQQRNNNDQAYANMQPKEINQ